MGIGYWPPNVVRAVTTEVFLRAYGTLGFTLCFDGSLETGIEKIAVYGKGAAGAEVPTHAALQLENGQWTSKIGVFEDISHVASDGTVYGIELLDANRQLTRRPRPPDSGVGRATTGNRASGIAPRMTLWPNFLGSSAFESDRAASPAVSW